MNNKLQVLDFIILILDLTFFISVAISFLVYIIPLFLNKYNSSTAQNNNTFLQQDKVALTSFLYAFIYFIVRHRFNQKKLKFNKLKWEQEKKLILRNEKKRKNLEI